MKHGLVIFPKSTLAHGTTAFEWWKKAAAKHGIPLEISFFEDFTTAYITGGSCELIDGKDVERPGFVVMRGYNAALSMHFETLGIPVYNRWFSMELSRNKIMTQQALGAAGVPMPLTICPFGEMDYTEAAGLIESEAFIVKAPEGSCGDFVFLVHDKEQYDRAVTACGGSFLIQQYVKASHGRDIRVWTVGDRAVACVMRKSDTSFKSNFSCGGSAVPYRMTNEIATLAVKAARTLNLDFAGVDILLGEDGPLVCEVNGNAGFRTLSKVGGPDILDELFSYILKKSNGRY